MLKIGMKKLIYFKKFKKRMFEKMYLSDDSFIILTFCISSFTDKAI
jgi:hypothetical protein